MKRNVIITEIGDKIIDELYILTDSFRLDYSDESDCASALHTACIKYKYGGKEYEVQVWACWPHLGDTSLEVEITGGKGKAGRWKYYDSLEQALLKYLYEKLSMSNLLCNLQEKLSEDKYDEWDDHGFRDEADYNNWRYGRSR